MTRDIIEFAFAFFALICFTIGILRAVVHMCVWPNFLSLLKNGGFLILNTALFFFCVQEMIFVFHKNVHIFFNIFGVIIADITVNKNNSAEAIYVAPLWPFASFLLPVLFGVFLAMYFRRTATPESWANAVALRDGNKVA